VGHQPPPPYEVTHAIGKRHALWSDDLMFTSIAAELLSPYAIIMSVARLPMWIVSVLVLSHMQSH
jgi:hypothetical protein